jgi:hypothetical protein
MKKRLPIGADHPAPPPRSGDDAIKRGELYRAKDVLGRLGLGQWAYRMMKRAGLNVRYVGGRAFLLGDDVIDFFARKEKENHQPDQDQREECK